MLCNVFGLTQICKRDASEKFSEYQTEAVEHRGSLVVTYRGWIVSLFSTTQAYTAFTINCLLCFHGSFKKLWEKSFEKKAHNTMSKEMLI